MKFKKKIFITMFVIAIIVTIIAVIFSLLGSDRDLKTVNYKVESHKVKQPFKIALITDYHSCNYGKGQRELLDPISDMQPDLILLGGDVLDDDLPRDNAMELLRGLTKIAPCYYVTGNHEFWKGDIKDYKAGIRSMGIEVLEGDCKVVTIKGQKVNICGIDDRIIGKDKMFKQLETAASLADKDFFTVLLAHRPEYINRYLEYEFDLIMAGHAHGGQWIIPGLINGIIAPNQGLFPKYAGGRYDFDKTVFRK